MIALSDEMNAEYREIGRTDGVIFTLTVRMELSCDKLVLGRKELLAPLVGADGAFRGH